MSVYLRAKFQVSSITLTSFEPLKSPPRLGLSSSNGSQGNFHLLLKTDINDFEFEVINHEYIFAHCFKLLLITIIHKHNLHQLKKLKIVYQKKINK